MTPAVWEMWTHVSVIWSQTENYENLFVWTKRATEMHFLYWRGNQWSQAMLRSTESLCENRGNQSHPEDITQTS